MITATINGKQIRTENPVTILDAAKIAGIKIPTLCHHDLLEPYGGCRLCLVEVEKIPRLQTSCTVHITDGMVVQTETERVVEARKAMLEFLLINHALDCPYCDKAGECDLQDLVMKYGPTSGRFTEGKRKHPESYDDPIIVRNMERCISCTRCVRMCTKVQGASAISMVNRSSKTFVEPFSGGRYNCEYCGNCLTVCPVGAIMSRLHKHTYRPWYIEKEIGTVCSVCGVGCFMIAQVRGNSIVRVVPETGKGVNKGLLCNRGRFGYDYISSSRRLKSPLIRKNGELQEASWSEAFAYVASRLKQIKTESGGSSVAGIASARCTNEDNYAFQKFMRVAAGSNSIGSVAGLAFAPAQKYFEGIFGQGVTANPISGIVNADGIFVIGGDPTSVNPVLGLQIRAAFQKKVPVMTVGYTPGLENFSSISLRPAPFTETIVLAALVSELLKRKSSPPEKGSFAEIINAIEVVTPEDAQNACGLHAGQITGCADMIAGMINPSIIIGGEIIHRSEGHANMLLLAALVHLMNGRIYLCTEFPNERGLVDMGCLHDSLPGGRPVSVESFRKRYEEFAGAEIPPSAGLSLMEIIDGARDGRVKALYVMGENIAFNLPDHRHVKEALESLDLLVVQDIFLTETARHADAVLPALAWAEKEGSYTNLEGRMQHLKKVVDGQGLEDWKILSEIGSLLGADMHYRDARDVLAEISKVSPLHKGVTYEDMDGGQCMWPYNGEPLRHDLSLPGIQRPDIKPLLREPEREKIYIGIEKPLFHSASMSRYSAALNSLSPKPFAKISSALGARLSFSDGDYVTISTSAGSLELPVVLLPGMPDNIVLVPNNFEEAGAYKIMMWRINETIMAPALDGIEVSLNKIERNPSSIPPLPKGDRGAWEVLA